MTIREQVTQAASQDPQYAQAVDMMEAQLARAPIVPEDLNEVISLLEFVLQNPDKYAEVRAAAIQDGIIEEGMVPDKFDQVFVVSLLIACYGLQDRIEQRGYSRGGLAVAARRLQSGGLFGTGGRGGDSELVHVNPREAEMLRRMGGSGTVNPNTGLREYKAFKEILGTVLPIALSFIPGIGPAIAAGLSSFGVGASTAAFLGPAIAGVGGSLLGSAITGKPINPLNLAISAFAPTITGGISDFVGDITGLPSAVSDYAGPAILGGITGGGPGALAGMAGQYFKPELASLSDLFSSPATAAVNDLTTTTGRGSADDTWVSAGQQPVTQETLAPTSSASDPTFKDAVRRYQLEAPTTSVSSVSDSSLFPPTHLNTIYNLFRPSAIQTIPPEVLQGGMSGPMGEFSHPDFLPGGRYSQTPLSTGSSSVPPGVLSPGDPRLVTGNFPNSDSRNRVVTQQEAQNWTLGGSAVAPPPSMWDKTTDFFKKNAFPLLAGAVLAGGLKSASPKTKFAVGKLSPQQQEYFNRPSTRWDWQQMEKDANAANMDLTQYMNRNWSNITGGQYNRNVTPYGAVGIASQFKDAIGMAHGGALSQIAQLAQGPGSGRDDTINARLSDGEYVIDAETVAMLGDGSTKNGSQKLDRLREQLRKHKGKSLAKGKFSPNARAPLDYIRVKGIA